MGVYHFILPSVSKCWKKTRNVPVTVIKEKLAKKTVIKEFKPQFVFELSNVDWCFYLIDGALN